MKVLLLLLGMLCGMSSFMSSAPAAPAVLVEKGQPRFVILTDKTPSPATEDAVQELNYWIERITGARLRVQAVEEWDGSTPYIAVGASELTRKNGWDKNPFRQEAARVFIEENRIGLLGNDSAPHRDVTWSGTYYAVLELVQKEFGVRWVWPGPMGEVFERRSTLVATPRVWSWAPQLTLVRQLRNGYNSPGIVGGLNENFNINLNNNAEWKRLKDEHEQWLKRQRMNKSSDVRFGHAYKDWWEKYSKDHPDWFAKPPEGFKQSGGHGVKLNISNPQVADQIIKNWKAAWEKNPATNKYLNVSPNDSRGFDTRPETRAWDAPELQRFSDKEIYSGSEPVLSDRFVKFWNILARRVREIDPETRLATYAYRNYRTPPLGNEKIENNIVVGYVGGEGYYPDERFIVDEWGRWAEKGAQLSWRPNLFNAGHGIPYEYSRALYNDFRFFQQNNLLGTDFDTLTGNWAGQGLNYYVLAEQHSRPDATYDELAGEYFAAFGPAAESVRRYHEYFEQITNKAPELLRRPGMVSHMTWGGWWRGHIRLIPLFMTPEVVAEGETILARAEQELQAGQLVHRERFAAIRRAFDHSKLMAETFRALQLHDPKAKANYKEEKEVLQPLWDYRQKMLTDLAVPVARLIFQEQRSFGLWDGFIQAKPENNQDRVLPLAKSWQFRADAGNAGLQQRWQETDGGAASWQSIEVGKPWRDAVRGVLESKVGWYLLSFDVPELADTGEKVLLQFGSVDAEMRLWVNGVPVAERGYPHNGNYDSWAEPFTVDITQAVRSGPNNVLTMRVESERKSGGITGAVSLLLKND